MVIDRFAFLIGHERCGTHMLGDMIGSHPDVCYLDEITTHAQTLWLRDTILTTRQLLDWLTGKFEDREEKVLLLDCKYEHFKFIRPLGGVVANRPCIQIVRLDSDAWFYSRQHALYRKEHELAEYGDTPKTEARRDYEAPTFDVDLEHKKWMIARMRLYERRYGRLADLRFTYEGLTNNREIHSLGAGPGHKICHLLNITYQMMGTTMSKMSPCNVEDYLE